MLEKMLNDKAVLLIGNGMNRFNQFKGYNAKRISWEEILIRMAKRNGFPINVIPRSFPYTEIFEIIATKSQKSHKVLKEEFIKELKSIKDSVVQKRIVDMCRANNVEILTSNFDLSLESVYNYVKLSDVSLDKGFTDFYPWQRYYSIKDESENHTKIWHIQGDAHYPRSIRLSVEDYIKNYEYFEKYDPLKEDSKYNKSITWLNTFFEKDVIIVGLALEEQEFFLRQILIKKSKYNKGKNIGKYIICKQDYELFKKDSYEVTSKYSRLKFFTDSVGLDLIEVDTFSEIYEG